MKATVGTVFTALQLANGERWERYRKIVKSAKTGAPIEKHEQLLCVVSILEEALKNCQAEIELPPDADEVLSRFSVGLVCPRNLEHDFL